MKKLTLKLFAILIVCFFVIVFIQFWHQDTIFKSRLNKDLKENGRMIFNNILRQENDFWQEKMQVVRQTALLFARLLARPEDPAAVAPLPLREFRYQIGAGEEALGLYTPDQADLPAQARAIAAGLPLLEYYLASLRPSLAGTCFISRDNWLASVPPLRAMETAQGHDVRQEAVYVVAAPQANPGKDARFSGLRFDDIPEKWLAGLSAPVYSGGQFQGVVTHDVPLERLFDLVRPNQYFSDSSLFILDDSFQVILHHELIPIYRRNDFDPNQKHDLNTAIRDNKTRQIVAALKAGLFSEKLFRFGGAQELVLTYRQESTGWRYVFALGPAKMFAHTRNGGMVFFGLNALVLLFFMLLLFFFLKTALLNPLDQINGSLLHFQQTGSGRVSGRRPLLFREIGRIFTNMESVFGQLQKKISETSENKEYLEKLMQTAQSMVITLDARMRPTSMNEYSLKKFQIGSEEISVAARR